MTLNVMVDIVPQSDSVSRIPGPRESQGVSVRRYLGVAALLGSLVAVACDDRIPAGALGRAGAGGGAAVGSANEEPGVAGKASIATRFDFIQIAGGPRHSCARLLDGRVKCWGENGGWLGMGDNLARGGKPGDMGAALPVVDLGLDVVVDAVVTKDLSVCALLHSGTVKCWGNNSMGELGQGDVEPRGGTPETMGEHLAAIDLGKHGRVVEVVLGGNHVCALMEDAGVYCWGGNSYGELGAGNLLTRGDEPGEMGQSLQPFAFGTGRHALQITAGLHHSCALLDDYSVKCWGQNNLGQLGAGDMLQRGDEPGEMGDALPKVNLGNGQRARAVFAGQEFTCAILEDRRVKCWGDNQSGQLGNGDYEARGDDVERMGDALPFTELGAGFAARSMALGSYHACAISTNGAVKCWGANGDGQLGLGSTENHGVPAESMGNGLQPVDFGAARRAVTIASGSEHCCANMEDGAVFCWGRNSSGQLGLGDLESRGAFPSQLGDRFATTALE